MHTPLDLCEKLGLTPTLEQHRTLTMLAECPRTVELPGDERHDSTRAVALFALWRVLSVQGSSAIVLSPSPQLSSDFMDYLQVISKRCHPHLAQVSGFPRWNVLQIGNSGNWELRVLHNHAALVARKAPHAIVSLILGAGDSDPRFVEAVKALEEGSTHEKNTLIRLW